MEIGICSFSFHRLLAAGKQDIFQYIDDCKALGCTQLDPWNAHLADVKKGDDILFAGGNPDKSEYLSGADEDYIDRVKSHAEKVGLPFGCIAVDGAHVYDPDPEKRGANRQRAYRWLEIAQKLGAAQVRIDAGGPQTMGGESYEIIKDGYRDIIEKAGAVGVEVLVENHWGPTVIPENCLKLLDDVPGLGLLLDCHNFLPEHRDDGRRMCASRARSIHLKTFEFDSAGNEISDEKCVEALEILKAAGYHGVWGVESMPKDGDEIKGAADTIALIRRVVG